MVGTSTNFSFGLALHSRMISVTVSATVYLGTLHRTFLCFAQSQQCFNSQISSSFFLSTTYGRKVGGRVRDAILNLSIVFVNLFDIGVSFEERQDGTLNDRLLYGTKVYCVTHAQIFLLIEAISKSSSLVFVISVFVFCTFIIAKGAAEPFVPFSALLRWQGCPPECIVDQLKFKLS